MSREECYETTVNVSAIIEQTNEQQLYEIIDKRFRLLGTTIKDKYWQANIEIHNDMGEKYDWYENCCIEYNFARSPKFIVGKHIKHKNINVYPIQSFGQFEMFNALIHDIREVINVYVTTGDIEVDMVSGSAGINIVADSCDKDRHVRIGLNNYSSIDTMISKSTSNLDLTIVNLNHSHVPLLFEFESIGRLEGLGMGGGLIDKLTLERCLINADIKCDKELAELFRQKEGFVLDLESAHRFGGGCYCDKYYEYVRTEGFRTLCAGEFKKQYSDCVKDVVISDDESWKTWK